MAKIEFGETVILILREPREKLWGVLHEINQAGVYFRGIDLNSFEELMRAVSNRETFYGLSEQFIPLWRLERLTKDQNDGDIPSLETQFENRTGFLLSEI